MKNICDRISKGLKEIFDSIEKCVKHFSFSDGKFSFTIPAQLILKHITHAMHFCIQNEKDFCKNGFVAELDNILRKVDFDGCIIINKIWRMKRNGNNWFSDPFKHFILKLNLFPVSVSRIHYTPLGDTSKTAPACTLVVYI